MDIKVIEYYINTNIGVVRTISTQAGLRSVDILPRSSQPDSKVDSSVAAQAAHQILEYMNGTRKGFSLSIDWSAISGFQKTVLEACLKIPYGEALTYGELARRIGKPSASRAVGAALGKNPIPIVIPCHRVVAANGHLTGYSTAEGILTKQRLLELEGHRIVSEKLV